jgi:predicted nucleic acid-binding protein
VTDRIVVDSYAWIEYAIGSEEGTRARTVIEAADELVTPAIVVAELADRAVRDGVEEQWTTDLWPFIRRHATVVPLDAELARQAGPLKWELRAESPEIGLADAIIAAVAIDHDAAVLTGDPDFIGGATDVDIVDLRD